MTPRGTHFDLLHYRCFTNHFTVFTHSLTLTALTATSTISFASAGASLTVRSRVILWTKTRKSRLSNSCAATYPNTAFTSFGLNGSTASHTKLNLPGFLPSWRKPKHGSNPIATIARVSRAVTIAVAKFNMACIGCTAPRAVNWAASSPNLPCCLPIPARPRMPFSGHGSFRKLYLKPCPLCPPNLRGLCLDMTDIIYRLCFLQSGHERQSRFLSRPSATIFLPTIAFAISTVFFLLNAALNWRSRTFNAARLASPIAVGANSETNAAASSEISNSICRAKQYRTAGLVTQEWLIGEIIRQGQPETRRLAHSGALASIRAKPASPKFPFRLGCHKAG